MDASLLQTHFARIGARVRLRDGAADRGVRLNVLRDGDGQFFDVGFARGADARVVHADPRLRHLLLLGVDRSGDKARFLCGHDEREWFVAAVPGRSVTNVRGAMEALKPAAVRDLQDRAGVRGDDRIRRRTAAYIRQGEWFFVPAPSVRVTPWMVLRDEPLLRGPGSKPHLVEHLFRTGGENVYFSGKVGVLTESEHADLLRENPAAKSWRWDVRRRNPTVFVKGRVRHPDHATVHLPGWHQVVMNTEAEAPGARDVMFLD